MTRQLRREDYTIGWVCALPEELIAALEMLDEEHDQPEHYDNDVNVYHFGSIAGHNVVILCLPAGRIGNNPAATVPTQIRGMFRGIKFGLMVGIGGGVPSEEVDIRLGDVVVSQPNKHFGGVIQYDSNKVTLSGLERKGRLNSPPPILLSAVASVQAREFLGKSRLPTYVAKFNQIPLFRRDKAGDDVLFEAAYDHKGGYTCEKCNTNRQVARQPRENGEEVVVHYGTIASGNRVQRDALERRLVSAALDGVLCFEMEAAGLMDNFPCLVIRGICDYADSHKNRVWQPYAAATAAAYAKELISVISPEDIAKARTVDDVMKRSIDMTQVPNCIRDLRLIDPRHDKRRIEETMGGLLKDSYRWILNNPDFQQWRSNQQCRLLWIKGDPGRGKTMLLCGIVDELKSSIAKTELLCYFFCQATDSRINNATAVLRGLMYLLIVQLPSLISHIGTKYEYAGKALFEDSNAWDTLSELFTNILQSLNLNSTYLIVDALDECVDFPKLLDFIVQMSSMSSQVKWIVSSNNRSDIEAHLEKARDTVRLCLELNTASISTAVRIFIEHKMLRLANKKHYDRQTYNSTVNSLYLKAENNFLWVALVCGILEEAPPWNTPLAILATFPPGLEPLYQRMMKQIWESEASGLCKQILALVATENQPMSVAELASRVKSFIPDNVESLYEIISFCNPFINIREDKIYFVHQSAKDFLFAKAFDEILSYRKGEGNQANNQAVIEILSDSRLKHSEKDSGYASASRPQTFSTSSEEPFQDNNIELPPAGNRNERKDLHDNEIESLPSDNDDTGSQASNETTNEEMAGKALLRVFLANEPQFRSLCEKAMTEMGNKRFVANMQRLLKSFHRNLLTEAEAETEKAIAKLLRSKRGRLRISQQLSDHIQQEREEGSQFDKSDLRVIPEYKNRVETWLAFAPERSVEIGRESQSANSGYSTSTTDDSSEEEFPHISKLEKFLCRTRSFQLLLKDCMLLFLPFQTRHLLSSIPKECIWVSSEQDLSISNRVKAWVEDFTQVRWNWLPLESRKRRLRPGESRIFWRCTCGARQWKEISVEQEKLVIEILKRPDDKLQSPYSCSTKVKRITLRNWLTRIIGKMSPASSGAPVSSASRRYTPSGNAAPTLPPITRSAYNGGGQSSSTALFQPHQTVSPIAGRQGQIAASGSVSHINSYVLFGVQGPRRTVTPGQIPTNNRSTDYDFFQGLKKCYQNQRGRLRLWFSIWRLENCDVVKFSRLRLDRMVRDHSDLPTDITYNYSPRSGDSGAKNPPISAHLFQALFYTCCVPCNWLVPHDCMAPPDGNNILERIPKRNKCFQRDPNSPIWGLEAVFAVSFAYVFVYHCVIVAGPLCFFGWWLRANPSDLQNASIPVTIALGALSLFWSGSGILTSRDRR